MISRCYRLQFWLRHTQLDNTLVMADMMFWKPPLLSTGMMVPYLWEVRKVRFAWLVFGDKPSREQYPVPVVLSAAKNLCIRGARFFAALRMTGTGWGTCYEVNTAPWLFAQKDAGFALAYQRRNIPRCISSGAIVGSVFLVLARVVGTRVRVISSSGSSCVV